jgi:hypothetical protein
MTRDFSEPQIVKLSTRDWIALIGIAATMTIGVMGAYLRIERSLIEILTRQQQLELRIDRIEETIDTRSIP